MSLQQYRKPIKKTQSGSISKRSFIKRSSINKTDFEKEFNEAKIVVIERDVVCVRCHVGGAHVHHIIPRSAGGSNDLNNLVLLCVGCHNWVHFENPKEARKIGLLADRTVTNDTDDNA